MVTSGWILVKKICYD